MKQIPITIHPFFWLLAAIIGWLSSQNIPGMMLWVFVILISVLVHELGHALTAIAFGQQAAIELNGMGGLTRRSGAKLKNWQDFIVVLNGPLAGFLLFLLADFALTYMNTTSSNPAAMILNIMRWVNITWTIINLLPIYPLDGGQLMTLLLEGIFGMYGLKASLGLSTLFAASCGVLFFASRAYLAGALFFLLTFESWRALKNSWSLSSSDKDPQLQQLLNEARDLYEKGSIEKSVEKFKEIMNKTKDGVIYVSAAEYIAQIFIAQGRYKEAYELLAPLKKSLDIEHLNILHLLAFRSHHFKEAIAIGSQTYQNSPNADTALINAFSHAILGEVKPAVGWLKSASRDGLKDLSTILKQREFDAIRQDPLFQNLVENEK